MSLHISYLFSFGVVSTVEGTISHPLTVALICLTGATNKLEEFEVGSAISGIRWVAKC